MGSFKHKPSRMLILLTAMAVLLPLLAGLQYYWLGQVSEGASERLQNSLRAGAAGFRRDFNRELIRAYLDFTMDSFTPPANPANQVELAQYQLDRLEQWNQTAPYPQLISDVFVVNYDEQGHSNLSRLDVQTKRLEPIAWSNSSGELASLRNRFEPSGQNSLDSFAAEVPALIVPFPRSQTQKQSLSPPPPPGYTIIKLDLNYMQRDFIPLLLKRHLFEDSQSEYNVAVVSLETPERVIYSSGHPVADNASSDVSARLFGLEADEPRSFLSGQDAPPPTGSGQTARRRLINLRFLKGSPDATATQPRAPMHNSGSAAADDDGRWQLRIKHRAGSLTAAVNNARRRNLAISFGILLLLGAGIFMTAVSTQRAERLARQQIDFVAGVTHELRTPLAVICSAGENLADGIVDTPEKVAQYGDVINREGRRLTDMVEQVLEFAGAQSGRQRYDFRSTDVSHFINGAVAACQTQIEERDFRIETSIEPNLPPVSGDGAALRRVVQNLISNAIKYAGDDKQNYWARISARVSPKVSGEKQGNEVLITVEDRGLGIGSSDLPHIFEPFYRGHQATAAQIEGSGVGLSLVKQIVEAHGGKISVESTPGAGSTFTISLSIAIQGEEHLLKSKVNQSAIADE
jgi:signal transduction histidine kinase